MNWTAIGAIGELIGALAVVITLIFLAVQLRHGSRSLDESNRLNRVGAVDRHNDTISRWRGRMMENEDLARIWLAATKDEELTEVDWLRLNNMFVDFANTQRANFTRAKVVGEGGLADLAALSVAFEIKSSKRLGESWNLSEPFMNLVSKDFVEAVNEKIADIQKPDSPYQFALRPQYVARSSEIALQKSKNADS